MSTPYQALAGSPPSPSSRILSPSPPRAHSPTSSLRALELGSSYTGPSREKTYDEDGDAPRGRMGRSGTVTSLGGFDFQHALLPLTLSGESEVEGHEERHVGLMHGIALVVGMQVGSGIFSSPGVVVAEVGSVGASLTVWVLSGLLAWTGASSFAELGCAIPLSGGAQAYLAYSFGPMASYLFTWAAVSTIKPGGSAIIALIFGEYVNRMIYHAATGDAEAVVPEWTFKITAVVAIAAVSILNLLSPTAGTRSAVVLTTIKMCSLLFVGILGILYLVRNGPGPAFSKTAIFDGSSTNPSHYALALYSGLWAFDGWDQCSYVGGEMRNPNRNMPLAVHTSMFITVALFVSANIAYFIVLDPTVVASSNTVALDFGRVTIGKFGAVVFSTLVSISCFGALNSGFYTTSRLIFAASKDHFLPALFTKLHPKRRTADNAMALQVATTVFFVIFGGGFRSLLNFFSVTTWTLYLVTVLGLLVLRVKEPHLERPYRAWLITPIVFCVVAMFLLLMPVFAAPIEAAAAFVFMAAGVPVFYLTASSRARQAGKGFAREQVSVWSNVQYAWTAFKDDITGMLPSRGGSRQNPTAVPQSARDREERRGMLSEQVEMSER